MMTERLVDATLFLMIACMAIIAVLTALHAA